MVEWGGSPGYDGRLTVDNWEMSAELSMSGTDIYELDGQSFLPECFSELTTEQVIQRSTVPLTQIAENVWWAKREGAAVIYSFDEGRLCKINVNAAYNTSFLGVNSGNPEDTLVRYGYEVRIRADEYTYLTLDRRKDHHIAISMKGGRFTELDYCRRNLEEFIHKLVEFEEEHAPEGAAEEEAGRLILELIHIGRTSGFASQKERTREIGKRLNDLGGFRGMQLAARRVISVLGGAYERDLEWEWHGIGEWQR